MSNDLLELLGVALAFAAILGLAEAARARGVRAEWTRKLVHVASGLVGAAFPWLFTSALSVAVLSGSYVVLMAVSRRRGWLDSVHGVRRRTGGGFFYPPAVACTFWLAGGQPAVYVSAILTLAVGDAVAALVGGAFGTIRYRVFGLTRSLQGSLAMAVSVYACVHLTLDQLTPLRPLECVLWSLHVAVLATLIEAVAPEGSDNFFVPLSACVVLLGMARGPVPGAELTAALAATATVLVTTIAAFGTSQPPVRAAAFPFVRTEEVSK